MNDSFEHRSTILLLVLAALLILAASLWSGARTRWHRWVEDVASAESGRGSAGEYYVNRRAQESGDHEVHRQGCTYLPARKNRLYLGYFESCREALQAARRHYHQIDGCYYCSRSCDSG